MRGSTELVKGVEKTVAPNRAKNVLPVKAIEKGMMNAEQANQMTKRDILQLIFAAGFSTSTVVSAVSGRGVGMDVVITNIKKLKGIIIKPLPKIPVIIQISNVQFVIIIYFKSYIFFLFQKTGIFY